MDTQTEAKIFNWGCLTVAVILVTFGIVGYFLDRRFWFGAAGVLVLWLVYCAVRSRREKKRLMDAFHQAFDGFGHPLPRLKTGTCYAYPTFTLLFASEVILKAAQAEGRIGTFKYSISDLYSHCGSTRNPFDASMAVSTPVDDSSVNIASKQ